MVNTSFNWLKSRKSVRRSWRASFLESPRRLKGDLAGEDLPEHHPIAHEAVKRMAKSGRPVLLEHQMGKPGEAVPRDQRGGEPPDIAGGKQRQQAHQRQAGAQEMQPPRGAARMLAKIEEIEFREAGIFLHASPSPVRRSRLIHRFEFAGYPEGRMMGRDA